MRVDRTSTIPLYRQVYEYFRDHIREGALREGDALPSIRTLERKLGVARESVKRAMSDLAHDGFITKIQGKGTFVSPRRAKRRFWGIVIPFYAEFYNKVILELARAADNQGVALEHACDYDDWRRQVDIVNDFAWRRAEAVVVVPSRDEPKTLGHLQRTARHRPVILFDHSSIASQLPYVIQDYVHGVRIAMEALRDLGAERIGYVRDPLWPAGNPIFNTMEEAYAQVCESLPGDYARVWDSPDALANEDLAGPEFDALLCVNDQVACLAVGMLRERGVDVPGRVQVVGYNNSDVGRFFTPQITTTSPDLPRMCRLVEEIILRRQKREPVELQQYVILPRLEARETTRGAEHGKERRAS